MNSSGNSVATPGCSEKKKNQIINDWINTLISGIFGGGNLYETYPLVLYTVGLNAINALIKIKSA